MKTMKVFNRQDMSAALTEALHKFANEFYGNDCYFAWTLGGESGCGYMTDDEEADVDAWLREQGADENETVLICWWW